MLKPNYLLRLLILPLFTLFLLSPSVRAEEEDEGSCGDEQQLACGNTERCCEHVVAMFSEAGASAPSYVEGRCIPKEQHCAEYWCGNRHCEAGFFGARSVCCVSDHPGLEPEYKCAYSELSCPGNSQQLSIRDRANGKARTLRS